MKEYTLFICNDDDDNLDDDTRALFRTDTEKFLAVANEKGVGTVYHYAHHHFANPSDSLQILKGEAFDELWAKQDVLMVFRTPDGDLTTWEY